MVENGYTAWLYQRPKKYAKLSIREHDHHSQTERTDSFHVFSNSCVIRDLVFSGEVEEIVIVERYLPIFHL